MEYLLLICTDGPFTPDEDMEQTTTAWVDEGAWLDGRRAARGSESAGRLNVYHLVPATRADLLRRLGRDREAAAAYRSALGLATTDAERHYLARRLGEVAH